MLKKDMRKAMADGAPVAVKNGYDKDTMATRAVIVALDQPRRVFPGTSFGSHITPDGVRVRYLDLDNDTPVDTRVASRLPGRRPIARPNVLGDEPEDTDERVVGPRDVLGCWDAWAARRDAVLAEREAINLQRQNARQESDRLAAELRKLGFNAMANADSRVVLSRSAAHAIVEELRSVRKANR